MIMYLIFTFFLFLPGTLYPLFATKNPREQAFLNASTNGNVQEIEKFLQEGINIKFIGTAALMAALNRNKIAVARILLEAGVDMGIFAGEFLERAISLGDPALVTLLLKQGVNPSKVKDADLNMGHPGVPPLALAAFKATHDYMINNPKQAFPFEIITILLKAHADLDHAYTYTEKTAQQVGSSSSFPYLLLRYIKSPSVVTEQACEFLKNKLYRRMCKPRVDLKMPTLKSPTIFSYDHTNCSHQTVLMWASALGHKDTVKALLACDPAYSYINARDFQNYTALMYGAKYNHPEVIKEFIAHDRQETDTEYTCIQTDKEHTPATQTVAAKVTRLKNNLEYVNALKEAADNGHTLLTTKLLFLLTTYNFNALG